MNPIFRTTLAAAVITIVACTPVSTSNTSSSSGPVDQSSKLESASAADTVLKTESDRLNAWFEERFQEELRFSPISMTFLGMRERYDEIDDMSAEADEAFRQWKSATVKDMEAKFNYDELDREAKMSWGIWKLQAEQGERGREFDAHGYIFEQMGGAQSQLPNFLMNFHEVSNEEELKAFIKRIGGTARAVRQLLERAQHSADLGIRAPRFAYDGAREQSEKLLKGKPFDVDAKNDAPLWSNAKEKIADLQDQGLLDDAQAATYQAAAKAALLNEFGAAYGELVEWLEVDVANASEEAKGAWSLPNGKAYYQNQLKDSTTTDLSAAEIHQIGLSEVARLRAEILAIKNEVGFDGDLQEFFAFIRTDPQFFFPDTDEGRQGYITGAEDFIGFIEKRLPDYFGILPKAGLIVKRVEAFREQDGAAQHYYPGTPDGSRPGIYYAHLSDMTAMPKNQMEVIAYHEGLPGHHMQISIAQELEAVPMFRTQTGFTAYVEGWALYSEHLAAEMGAYQDPYSRVGRLSSEIWRGIRLVVDTGLHEMGWTEEQAVEYFKQNSPEPEESIRSEVRRYIVWPGQATSYKIGMLKILELRAAAKETLGDQFDIRDFHDTVLSGGALPLHLLEQRVRDWVDGLKG